MDEEWSYLVDIKGFEPVCDEMVLINPNFSGQKWPIIDSEALCEKMRHVYKNQDEASEKGKLASENMMKSFSYDVISNRIIEILKG